MRLRILSDLHLEFGPFTPPAVEADAVVLARDVSTDCSGLKWAMKTFPDQPVIYVLGSHEFYGRFQLYYLASLVLGLNIMVWFPSLFAMGQNGPPCKSTT